MLNAFGGNKVNLNDECGNVTLFVEFWLFSIFAGLCL
jgi:hypothetical protein